jgi:hypothetical protein
MALPVLANKTFSVRIEQLRVLWLPASASLDIREYLNVHQLEYNIELVRLNKLYSFDYLSVLENNPIKWNTFRTLVLPSLAVQIIRQKMVGSSFKSSSQRPRWYCLFDACNYPLTCTSFSTKQTYLRHIITEHGDQLPANGSFLMPKATSIQQDGFCCHCCSQSFSRLDHYNTHMKSAKHLVNSLGGGHQSNRGVSIQFNRDQLKYSKQQKAITSTIKEEQQVLSIKWYEEWHFNDFRDFDDEYASTAASSFSSSSSFTARPIHFNEQINNNEDDKDELSCSLSQVSFKEENDELQHSSFLSNISPNSSFDMDLTADQNNEDEPIMNKRRLQDDDDVEKSNSKRQRLNL